MEPDFEQKTQLQLFAELLRKRQATHNLTLSLKAEARRFADTLIESLFPLHSEKPAQTVQEVTAKLVLLKHQVAAIINSMPQKPNQNAEKIAAKFFNDLPEIYNLLWLDAEAIYKGDPAAESLDEVVLAYPGFLAIAIYRLAHNFYMQDVPIFPRLLTEYAHQLTGIDIHPGAKIGKSFCIDHGTGIVIGETTVIGDNVKMYQGVTLGALSVEKSLANTKRHPTIEDNVVIYAQAVILGGGTVIGHDSVIGGNSWITRSVPPFSYVHNDSKVSVRTPNETNGGIEFVI